MVPEITPGRSPIGEDPVGERIVRVTAVPSVFRVRCNYCSKQRYPWEVHRLQNAQLICDDCIDWHNRAMEFLAGRALPGCQACGVSWELLRDSAPGVEIRMYVVPRDGIYQVLCRACVMPYISKRADLYKDTAFGRTVLKI